MEVRRMNMKMSGGASATTVVQPPRHTAAQPQPQPQPQPQYDNRSRSSSSSSKMTVISKSKSRSSYFSLESMLVLLGLTASLLILPLILPPLPPPPLMLLLLPIFILGVLMVFAFMPSGSTARHKAIV